ncbi:Ser/Thr protein kinase RdoA (MazF antagonist) [Paenibacillus sacheonensis]|nr:Ser/Thr protein kinase RdoA (MazF antagonist) [Paenibacillus sacheonensis]
MASVLYGLEGYACKPANAHEGGRNVVYVCEKGGEAAAVLRIAFLQDRTREDFLGELEFVRYLFEHGGSVPDVVGSRQGNLLEEVAHDHHTFFICLFQKAAGKTLAENQYRYREGAPMTEYFFNCGKVLGKLHQLSKGYTPSRRRYGFHDKFNADSIEKRIPGSLPLLKEKMLDLLKALEELDKNREAYGIVHFDFNDGNYAIDFATGQITVYDFDNCCSCWYMFDVASLWTNGTGWIQFEPDAGKRRAFMDAYFKTALEGYKSETGLGDALLEKLHLFIQVNLMESIMDAFEVMRNNGEAPECNEALSYRIKCLEDDIPYLGFFHDIYACDEPFEHDKRTI